MGNAGSDSLTHVAQHLRSAYRDNKALQPSQASPDRPTCLHPTYIHAQLQGTEATDSSSQHLPRAHQLSRSSSSALAKQQSRTLRQAASARDWTAAAAAAQAAAGGLPGGFQQHRTTLPAARAVQPCNATIPLLLLWHESYLPDGLTAPPSPADGTADSGAAAAPEAQGGGGEGQPGPRRLPVVIWLHATAQCAADMVPRMEAHARRGFLTAAIDCRYHGERTDPSSSCTPFVQYQDAVYRCAPPAAPWL